MSTSALAASAATSSLGLAAPALWAVLAATLAICMAVDLWVHRRPRGISLGGGMWWSSVWISVAVAFAAFLWLARGAGSAAQFAALYLTEKSLSIDNMLVLAVLVAAIAVPRELRHRVLMLGALLAIALRLLLILGGVYLLERFEWLMYAFGFMLIPVAMSLLRRRKRNDAEGRRLLRFANRLPSRSRLASAVTLVVVADLIFALDSIPAALALSLDPFLVFSANAFAVIGLRALYFVVEGAIERFDFVKVALGVLLLFVGSKLMLHPLVTIPVVASLAVITGILALAALLGWLRARGCNAAAPREPAERLRPRVRPELHGALASGSADG